MKTTPRAFAAAAPASRAGLPARAASAAGALRRAWAPAGNLLTRVSLFQRFAVVSLLILIVGAYVIGSYVSGEIQARVIQRTSALTALYVDSFVSPHLQELKSADGIGAAHLQQLDQLLSSTSLGQKIVSFKIWHKDGDIVYSNERDLVGRRFPVTGPLEKALSGEMATEISDLSDEENVVERQRFSRLLETYAPIHSQDTGEVIGVSEFYQDPSDLESEISSSQRKGWLIVGGSTAAMYLLLVGMVGGASNTISRQHKHLDRLARRNASLASRVRLAAAKKSETDELFLRRIAQDLHDGPAQDVSLALLRLESLGQADPKEEKKQVARRREMGLLRTALSSALKEIREISAGLRLPEMESLPLREVIARAVQEHRNKTGDLVRLAMGRHLPEVTLPVKIALYRVTQEALNNAHQHAGVLEEDVQVRLIGGAIHLQVSDSGSGLGASTAGPDREGRTPLGVRGMRERVEMLGGALQVSAAEGRGTIVSVVLPLLEEDGEP